MPVSDDIQALRTKITRGITQANRVIFAPSGTWPTRYLWFLILATFAFQLAHPIVMGDTDMWYHLAGGRLLWEHGQLPDHPYFSFTFPDRKWVAYFWGFQAGIYPIYETLGYQGLIIARALLFSASFVMIAAYLYAGRQRHFNWLLVGLAILYLLLLEGRGYQLRPHLVSYAMVPAFLYILEFRRNLLWLLPGLTIAWANLHGVTWVIGATVVGAYFIEGVRDRKRGSETAPSRRQLAWLLACLPAMLVNPFGLKLLTAPFAIPPHLNLLIGELLPLSPAVFSSVYVSGLSLSIASMATILMLTVLTALARGVIWGGTRLSHAILALAGLALLTRGNRFMAEWALLSLPLATTYVAALRPEWHRLQAGKALVPALAVIAVLAVPIHDAWRKLPLNFEKYPFDPKGLPLGTIGFLKQHKARGNLLASPNYGGYINWALYPEVLVHSDMEFPPFDADAALEISYAIGGSNSALEQIAARHPIDFVAIQTTRKSAGKAIEARQDFEPVFFDDVFVLYVNRSRQPELAERFRLRHVDPFNLLDKSQGTVDERLAELERIREIWPQGHRVNHAIARILFNEKRFEEALPAAERFAALYPDDPNSHFLVGDSLEQLDRFDAAIREYRQAIPVADASFQRTLHQHIGTCFYLQKKFADAYDAFRLGINPFAREAEPETRYQYAFSATLVGDVELAKLLLKTILWGSSDKTAEVRDQAQALLDKIERGDLADDGNVLDFLGSLMPGKSKTEADR